MDQFKYWNKVAEKKEFPTPFKIEEFMKYTSKKMKILDVGCGYGRTLNELHNHGFKNLTGIDYAQEMINRGTELFPHLKLQKSHGAKIPFPDKTFNAVIIMGVLTSNISDKEQENLIKEILRILKDQGILYLADFLINQDERNMKRYQKYKDKYGTYGIFELPEGAVLRHHTEEHIFKLTEGFNKLIYKKTVYNTMNKHESNGFYFIGQKK